MNRNELPPEAAGEVLLWADAVHERIESMQLHFWRLAFAPRYPREEIFAGLQKFYKEAGITSYVTYETLGDFDLLLRVWTPKGKMAEELELMLRQHLQGCFLWNLNYLVCKTELHFSDGEVDCKPPSNEALEQISDFATGIVNSYNDEQWSRYKMGDPKAPLPARPETVEELISNGILRPVSLATRGIRLFITFDHPRQPFRPETRDVVVGQIMEKCNEINQRWEGLEETLPSGETREVHPPKVSIYAGGGSMTDFLVMVRAPHGHFHAFVSDLIIGLRDIRLDKLYEMRPYTHVVADRMFSEFKEHRKIGTDVTDVNDLIKKEENESLEFKATLATNFRSLIVADRREPDPSRLDEVVKAVCGLLNSPRGGVLVLGILEVKRELEKSHTPEQYLEKLERDFDYSPIDEKGERSIPHAVVGVEVDLDPGPFPDLDRYIGHLRDSLKSRIQPNPWAWLRVTVEEVGDRRICMIWVRPGDVWFYAKMGDSDQEEFFVREGASTPAYTGAAADLYKQAHPRKPPELKSAADYE